MRITAITAFAATLVAMTAAPASAADFYLFGLSGGANIHSLLVNGTTTINSTNAGWFNSDGDHVAGLTNYIVGRENTSIYRNFFIFASTGGATSLTLQIASLGTWDFGGNSSLVYTLRDVSSTIDTLQEYAGATGIFADLGTGATYASATYTNTPTTVSFVLNQAALDDFNLAGDGGGNFGIGGALANVPEPASWAMLITGFGLVGAAARRRRRTVIAAA